MAYAEPALERHLLRACTSLIHVPLIPPRAAKTTLGALSDDAPGFTLEELAALKALCEAHGAELGGCEG